MLLAFSWLSYIPIGVCDYAVSRWADLLSLRYCPERRRLWLSTGL